MELNALGWNARHQQAFDRVCAELQASGPLSPGRVAQSHKLIYHVLTEQGECHAEVTGALRHSIAEPADFPTVGDWVAVSRRGDEQRATIHRILPRESAIVRKLPGIETAKQVLAANVDYVLLIVGLDRDYNPRRIERYLALAWETGAQPVIVLNKRDLCPDVESRVQETTAIAIGVPVHAVSAEGREGLEQLETYNQPGKTLVLLGSSGAGKSTLVNRLLGYEHMATQAVRESDQRGRHTTTRRELVLLPSGGIVIDTPGLRELQLWADDTGLQKVFEDIEALAPMCRFRDCTHEQEPGCAVREALDRGELDERRYKSYMKLKGEVRHLETRQSQRAQAEEKGKWKQIAKQIRKVKKMKGYD